MVSAQLSALDLYERAGLSSRPTQVEALRFLEGVYNEAEAAGERRYVLCEAPTGTGKSYIMLLLALSAWLKGKKRSVISTHTHVLQTQIAAKDYVRLRKGVSSVPGILEQGLDQWKARVIKGRDSFPCLCKVDKYLEMSERFGDLVVRDREGKVVLAPKQQMKSLACQVGGGMEFVLPESDPLSRVIAGSREECMKETCPYYQKRCLYYRNLRGGAPLLVVNHAMLLEFLELSQREQAEDGEDGGGGKKKPLGLLNGHLYFFDEAHHLMGYRVMGVNCGEVDFNVLKQLMGAPIPLKYPEFCNKMSGLVKRAMDWQDQVMSEIVLKDKGAYEAMLGKGWEIYREYLDLGAELEKRLRRPLLDRHDIFRSFLCKLQDVYKGILEGRGEVFTEGRDRILLSSDKGRSLKEDLGAVCRKMSFGAFLSGTMAIGGSFDVFKVETGIDGDDVRDIKVKSPFKFDNLLIWAPRDVPVPGAEERAYEDYICSFCEAYIPNYVDKQLGGVLVLCSSHRRMNMVAEVLIKVLPPGRVFVQGSMPKKQLTKAFLFTPSSVLVGSASFREGFDAPGDKLTWVIVDRLPFAPVDKQLQTRLDRLKQFGNVQDPFAHQLSKMMLLLVQSVGRLIRTEQDRGIITVLDPRVWNPRWNLDQCLPGAKDRWLCRLPDKEDWNSALDKLAETQNFNDLAELAKS